MSWKLSLRVCLDDEDDDVQTVSNKSARRAELLNWIAPLNGIALLNEIAPLNWIFSLNGSHRWAPALTGDRALDQDRTGDALVASCNRMMFQATR